jgi:NTP pyrophosphatase (non-canonical NTP hydrolase)
MNITHSEMVARLMKPKSDLQFTTDQCDMIHAILGISGECGELLDAVKKHVIYKKPMNIENLIEELGDMEFYIEHLRTIFGITREQTISANMAKLVVRYPGFQYTDGAAQARAERMTNGN